MDEIIAYVCRPKTLVILMVALIIILEVRRGYFRDFVAYSKTVGRAPYLLILALSAAGFLCVSLWDQALLGGVREIGAGVFKDVFVHTGGLIGKFYGLWVILTFFYISALLSNKRKWSDYIFSAILSAVFAGLLSHIAKHLFSRSRPFVANDPYDFFDVQGILESTRNYQSFPSGDVSIVAGSMAFFFFALKGHAVRYLFLILPILTAFSRVLNNKHWPSDTLFSMGVGFLGGYFIFGYCQYVESRSRKKV